MEMSRKQGDQPMKRGIMNDVMLRAAAETGEISAKQRPIDSDQIQPASLDLRLSNIAYRVRASFLPGKSNSMMDRLGDTRITMHTLNLDEGAVLETGCVYVVPLMERMALSAQVSGLANPKSSTGRIDVFTRVITEDGEEFDHIPAGYSGLLYAEISPRTFSVLARTGDRLCQLRLWNGLRADPISTITVSVDLSGQFPGGVAGFRARRHAGVVDLARIGEHAPAGYWEPIYAERNAVVLDPGEFYILASKEAVVIGADTAAEMAPIATEIGEFRAHYAGFFDPGFGLAESGGQGGRAVLEVRGRDVPFFLEDGQAAARLIYERMAAPPERLYGAVSSNYQGQGLKLSKHFSPWPDT